MGLSRLGYDSEGIQGGIEWSIRFIGDRKFMLQVGVLSEVYNTEYPTRFGLDGMDVKLINERMDEMQLEVESL